MKSSTLIWVGVAAAAVLMLKGSNAATTQAALDAAQAQNDANLANQLAATMNALAGI